MLRRNFLFLTAFSVATPAFALYDPEPVGEIWLLEGEWHGTLTYNDYSSPGKLVTLKTQLFAALSSPSELVLHYVYDDGPGKTVYSYERMTFQPEGKAAVLASGGSKPSETTYAVVSNTRDGDMRKVIFEDTVGTGTNRFTLEFGPQTFVQKHEEIEGAAVPVFRNEYRFRRAGA